MLLKKGVNSRLCKVKEVTDFHQLWFSEAMLVFGRKLGVHTGELPPGGWGSSDWLSHHIWVLFLGAVRSFIVICQSEALVALFSS